MPAWESVLAAELSTRHHVTTRKRLQRIGLSRRVDRRIVPPRPPRAHRQRCPRLPRRSRDVRTALGHRMRPHRRRDHVSRQPGRCGSCARHPPQRQVHVTVPRQRTVITARDWIAVHRSCDLARCDVVNRGDGIVVTSPPRTTFDAAAWLNTNDLESLIEQGMARGYFTVPTLWGHARRLCRRGRHGSARFVEVLSRREVWRRPVDSDYELRLERAMRAAGFPPLTRQHPCGSHRESPCTPISASRRTDSSSRSTTSPGTAGDSRRPTTVSVT